MAEKVSYQILLLDAEILEIVWCSVKNNDFDQEVVVYRFLTKNYVHIMYFSTARPL